jgi:asparagine synthase (glutamine-hydrolysing)
MCGINGIITDKQLIDKQLQLEVLTEMNKQIIHRGPDDGGIYQQDNISMGMRRLSIIDLSSGHQPMFNQNHSLAIVFNGEIYNYLELKAQLVLKGITFNTTSDTEVVLKMYEVYGAACVNQLNGMFAFSIHDIHAKKVFIARDRFGEKPLYYTLFKGQFIWASELKSIIRNYPELKQVSTRALNCYFALSYIPAPLTIYDEVFKLKPGYTLTIDTDSLVFSTQKYWDIHLKPDSETELLTYAEAKKKTQEILTSSVEQKMIADVPLGVFLSGGVDSSIVAALMAKVSDKKIKTFSVGFENKRYDESERATLISKHIGSEHFQYTLNYNEILASINAVILNYDEPFADSSCLPTYFVSLKAREEVKVALTGDGGDEVFGGYNKYLVHTYGNIYRNIVPSFIRNGLVKNLLVSNAFSASDTRSKTAMLRKFISSVDDNVVDSHLNIIALGFKQDQLAKLLTSDNLLDYQKVLSKVIEIPQDGSASLLKVARYIDKQISLEGDMLTKVDRVSMLASLECRSPFLDYRLMELTYQMPDSFLLKGYNKKRILKDSFAHLMPTDFFNAPKKGFEVPISHWFRSELREDLLATLSPEMLNKHFYFKTDYIQQLIKEHLSLINDHSHQLWTLYCFQKWYNSQLEL